MFRFLSLVPDVIGVVKVLEAELPLTGNGKTKVDAAVTAFSGAFDVEQDLQKSWGNKDAFLAAVVKAVSFAVSLLNALGVFTK